MHKVGTKGQVVIEKRLREKLGIGPGWIAVQRVVGDHLEIDFLPPEHTRSLQGILAPHTNVKVAPEDWHEAKEEAWAQAVDVPKFRPGWHGE